MIRSARDTLRYHREKIGIHEAQSGWRSEGERVSEDYVIRAYRIDWVVVVLFNWRREKRRGSRWWDDSTGRRYWRDQTIRIGRDERGRESKWEGETETEVINAGVRSEADRRRVREVRNKKGRRSLRGGMSGQESKSRGEKSKRGQDREGGTKGGSSKERRLFAIWYKVDKKKRVTVFVVVLVDGVLDSRQICWWLSEDREGGEVSKRGGDRRVRLLTSISYHGGEEIKESKQDLPLLRSVEGGGVRGAWARLAYSTLINFCEWQMEAMMVPWTEAGVMEWEGEGGFTVEISAVRWDLEMTDFSVPSFLEEEKEEEWVSEYWYSASTFSTLSEYFVEVLTSTSGFIEQDPLFETRRLR
jgi:hypothetical protein